MRAALPALLAGLLAAPPGPDRALEALVDRLQQSYDRLDGLEADFVQVLRSVALGEPQEERGHLYLSRPARMRWEYRSPEEKLAIVDGERTYLYVPAENQVIVGTLDEVRRSGAAGLLLAGRVHLRRDFRIESGGASPDPDVALLTLIPASPEEDFSRIDLAVSADDLLPVRIVVHGQVGEVMEYRLSNVRAGVSPDPSLFRFEPPEGVEIVLAD
jgi:outer membrane lipoprotein carrier protein